MIAQGAWPPSLQKGTEFTARRDRLPVEPDARIAFVLVRARRRLSRVILFARTAFVWQFKEVCRVILDFYPIDLTSFRSPNGGDAEKLAVVFCRKPSVFNVGEAVPLGMA